MRRLIPAVLASASIALASPTVFSVHDDLLAFPQYEVVFSDSLISDTEAGSIIERAVTAKNDPPRSPSTGVDKRARPEWSSEDASQELDFDPSTHTYEMMWLKNEEYLCTIPIVVSPERNETSEAAARAAEQKELARATDRGWELLQELEGNCLYFVSGWWSYAFCYNAEVTQFHALPQSPGKPPVLQRDPNTMQFVLGKAKVVGDKKTKKSEEDEWGNAIDIRKPTNSEPPNTELQVKGDTRYLVQRMDDGTTCDLTGKPRRVEVQYHCDPHVADRIGFIKEITTCSYLLVVYTPRLCNDVAFMPPKESKAHQITCRVVVSEEDILKGVGRKSLEAEAEVEAGSAESTPKPPINVGGIILGGGKFHSSEGQRMPVPPNFAQVDLGQSVEVIVRAKSKAEGGKIESVSDEELIKLDLDPDTIEDVKKQVAKMAKDKGWKIEVVDAPGQVREILGIVDADNDKDAEVEVVEEVAEPPKGDTDAAAATAVADDTQSKEGEESEEGSEEVYKDEL